LCISTFRNRPKGSGHPDAPGRKGTENAVFGIDEKADHTLEEVGQNFDVTRERIRQIEAKALRKLRHPSRSKNFDLSWRDEVEGKN